MPEEISPGFTLCVTCGRVAELRHVNTSGRCVLCAGKTADQLEEAQEQLAGNRMAADGGALVTPEPAGEEDEA